MFGRWLAIVVIVATAFGAVFVAWRGSQHRTLPSGLDEPTAMTVYSIDGNHLGPGGPPERGGAAGFHLIPVLGMTEIADEVKRREIATALKRSIAAGRSVADCFEPRHAVRTVENGETFDYVICFQCLHAEVHVGATHRIVPLDSSAKDLLNKTLTAAGVPLARGAEND